MAVLSDRRLRAALTDGEVGIVPSPDPENIGPCSIDLTLSDLFREPKRTRTVDLGAPRSEVWRKLDEFAGEKRRMPDGKILRPGECLIGETVERVSVPPHLVGRVDGRSLLGRFFLIVHVTAMHMHPGWSDTLVLEFVNHGPSNLLLRPGMRICAIYFEELTDSAERPYGVSSPST